LRYFREARVKQINISDEDYMLLMELTKELQTQENDSQAFPYFWSPRSTKSTIGTDDDTPMVYDSYRAEIYTLEGFAEGNDEEFAKFLNEIEEPPGTLYSDINEDDWRLYLEDLPDLRIVYSGDEEVSEANHSLFKSDVKHFIKYNSHHLGGRPHTYANSVWRMPKMEQLVSIIYRLIPQPEDECNHEARRFIYPGK
jgi:hypothetical protein